MKKLILVLVLILIPQMCEAATRWIRTDGGTGTQCTGLADAAYDGSGSGEACSLNSPYWLFPNTGSGNSTAVQADANDTVVIKTGSYRIGCQNSINCRDSNINLVSTSCNTSATRTGCNLGAIPAGVTFIGCSETGCASESLRPELWGAGRASYVLSVLNKSGVTIQDVVLTDHAALGFSHKLFGTNGSNENQPNELSAQDGINFQGASDLMVKNVSIHGVTRAGMIGGYTSGFITLDNTNLSYNSFVGFDLDICFNAGNCGTSSALTTFKNGTTISYNGCIESTTSGTIIANGCYSQDQGGNGDGVAVGNTGGTWVFTDVNISHNVSDGIDLLYLNRGQYSGGSVSINRSRFEGNASNQVKIGVDSGGSIEDSTIIGNCYYFNGRSTTCSQSCGQGLSFNNCRASGNPVHFAWNRGGSGIPTIYNSTILGNGDVLILTNGGACPSSRNILVKNSILRGGDDYSSGSYTGDQAGVFSKDDGFGPCQGINLTSDYNVCYGLKDQNTYCTGTNDVKVDPLFAGTIMQEGTLYTNADYHDQLTIQSGSPAVGTASTTISGTDNLDYNSYNRGPAWDKGALEYGTIASGGAVCGDNNAQGAEPCDGSDLRSQTCGTIIPGSTGSLVCTSCVFVTSGCSAVATCPNGTINAEVGETCDDNNSTNGDGCSSECLTETSCYALPLFDYTENDPNSKIDRHTNSIDFTGLDRNATTRVYKDFGTGFFGNFTHNFTVNIGACNDNVPTGGNGAIVGVWALSSNLQADMLAMQSNGDGITLNHFCKSSDGIYRWDFSADGGTSDSYLDTAPPGARYMTASRTGTALTMAIYSDSGRTVLLDTLTATNGIARRYYYPVTSYNNSKVGTSETGSVSNIDLQNGCQASLFCGDNSCNASENCNTCPGDCGVCPIVPSDTTKLTVSGSLQCTGVLKVQ